MLVVLLYPANNFAPSLTINPEICWLTGADMVHGTLRSGSSEESGQDYEKLIACRPVMEERERKMVMGRVEKNVFA